ncbi:MAG: Coenzyme F420 hydrogenase/dehydrogenase, beta subunit C-terminal domain [Clostridium sp.]|nr:Coenzyme F420 hydrogenase/dehydrogenase, beta subunit C-terminal domain [Clostridium sp.]
MCTVEFTVDGNLCISCGMCKAVCPKNSIKFQSKNGLFIPVIDKDKCAQCGMCYRVCPGKGFDYTKHLPPSSEASFLFGEYCGVYTAWSLDEQRRSNSVSGGVVTELVYRLLQSGEYKTAFLVGTHKYTGEAVCTQKYIRGDALGDTQKSRYLPVCQEQAVSYILSHPAEKIILVGTGCFVEGMLNLIDCSKLDRHNYLIIGLFCDRMMTMNVVRYFGRHKALKGQPVDKMFFRTKEVGGWPGGVQITVDSGEKIALSNSERMKVKDYFMPERCMYCLDKLNLFSDLSVGDNYTGKHADARGSNSVIVRTEAGRRVWERYAGAFGCEQADSSSIWNGQHLKERMKNHSYAKCKEREIKQKINVTGGFLAEPDVNLTTWIKYRLKYLKTSIGANYDRAEYVLSLCLIWKNLKLKVGNIVKRSSICL